MVRPHAYLNGGVTHLVQQAQWAFFNTACSLPLFPGTPNANTNAGGNKSCWNAQHRIERFNWLGEQICKFIGKNRKGLRKYKNTQMKTATITTSIIVQRREEDQDCDAKEKKKINDTVLWVPLCQPANADVFSVVASILSIRKVTFRERSDDRKHLYSRGFLCAKPRLFCKLLCCFLFSFFPFLGKR